jgi:UDP-N-acetylmuramate dehydrogenase
MKENSNKFKGLKKYIEHDIILADFTTMQIGGPAKYFFRVRRQEELPEILDWARNNNISIFVLGGGSNLLASERGFPGLVLKMEIYGINCYKETSELVELEVSAGETWDSFVEYTVKRGYWGIENMSLIPGTVGAVAVQNVSAYGQESMMVINKVRVYDMKKNMFVVLMNDECKFGFRKSIFNTEEPNRYIIVAVYFILNKYGKPNLSRREIAHEIDNRRQSQKGAVSRFPKFISHFMPQNKRGVDYDLTEIRQAVIKLRTSGKLLPKPNTMRNCGTFFRASIIQHSQTWDILLKVCKNIGLMLAIKIIGCKWKYTSGRGYKLPSNLLIKACGLENLQYGNISLFKTNCAVLVNCSNESNSTDILYLIKRVRTTVYRKTGVVVPVEPCLVGFTDSELKEAFSLECSESKIVSCN